MGGSAANGGQGRATGESQAEGKRPRARGKGRAQTGKARARGEAIAPNTPLCFTVVQGGVSNVLPYRPPFDALTGRGGAEAGFTYYVIFPVEFYVVRKSARGGASRNGGIPGEWGDAVWIGRAPPPCAVGEQTLLPTAQGRGGACEGRAQKTRRAGGARRGGGTARIRRRAASGRNGGW